MKQKTLYITLIPLFTAILVILSQIMVPMPSGVPVTLQTFAIALIACTLGPVGGLISVLLYLLLGAVGVPVFAGFKGGLPAIVGPTGGYLVGFLPMVFLAGYASDRKRPLPLRALFLILSILPCHICGMFWLAYSMKIGVLKAFLLASFPYLLKDLVSVLLPLFLTEPVMKQVDRMRSGMRG